MGNPLSATKPSRFLSVIKRVLDSFCERFFITMVNHSGCQPLQLGPHGNTVRMEMLRDITQNTIQAFSSMLRSSRFEANQLNITLGEFVPAALKSMFNAIILYSLEPPTDPTGLRLFQDAIKTSLGGLALAYGAFFGSIHTTPSRESERSSAFGQPRSALEIAVSAVQSHQGEKLGSWLLTEVLDGVQGTDVDEDSHEAMWKEFQKLEEIKAWPYNDQHALLKRLSILGQQERCFIQSHGQEFLQTVSRYIQEVLDNLEDNLSPFEQISQNILSCLQRGITFLVSTRAIEILDSSMYLCAKWNSKYVELAESQKLERSVLPGLNFLAPSSQRDLGENGYTKIFIGGKRYRIWQLRRELLRRNTNPDPPDVPMNVVTVAISYKHYWENNEERISTADFQAIASFIKASRYARIRFWVDTKLPPTTDSSFERWLKRGVSPFSRYLTLMCPSASASQDRFWIANEKYIATAGRGILYFHQDDILFDQGIKYFHEEAKLLLKLVIGEEELPPGVNEDDEAKVYQWALGMLGSESNEDTFTRLCPWFGKLYFEDFNEYHAIKRIQEVIKEHGPQFLPLIPGRTWNKHNPLMKGCTDEQKHQMLGWIGFVHPEDKKRLYFVHIFLLDEIEKSELLVLRVRLGKAYDEQEENSIEEKVITMMDTNALREMVAVVVPSTCDWEVFSDLK